MIEVTMRKCLLYGRKGINAVQGVFNRGRCKETEYSRLKVFKIGYLWNEQFY